MNVSLLRQFLDLILPPRCLATGEIVDTQGMVAPQVWRDLDFIGEPLCACCGFPFGFAAAPDALCAACLADRPEFSSARSAVAYGGAGREMILKFKHADQLHAVDTFVPWLRRAGGTMLAGADCAVPVPLHPLRLLRRRYNQAALIARVLARDCGIAYVPDALVRRRATVSQGHLGAAERQKNVGGAFALHPRAGAAVRDRIVVLVDDVYTTGATVRECTKILLKGGAREVHVLTVARVVRSGS